MKSFLNIVYGVLIGFLVAGIIWLATSHSRGESITLLPTVTPGKITIYIIGSVVNPGVYVLPAGSRLGDAIQSAGGFTNNAIKDKTNLAALLVDGQQINVPEAGTTSDNNLVAVNINTASLSDLDALPGIGPTTAQAIINYRLQNGPFQFIQEIQNVPGIGSVTFNSIKDYISTGP